MSDVARFKMDCSQCPVFRTTVTFEEADRLREEHTRNPGHNSAIVTKLRYVRTR